MFGQVRATSEVMSDDASAWRVAVEELVVAALEAFEVFFQREYRAPTHRRQ